jgi:amidase
VFGLNRREFLCSSALGSGAAALGNTANARAHKGFSENGFQRFELDEMSISDFQKAFKEGETSAERIVELYLKRIEEIDRDGPCLRAILEINPEATEIAAALDRERKANGPRGPLHGIPVVVKDNFDTADQMTTTAGSMALEGSIPASDSFVVRNLREAGAVILAKANLSEWANFRSTRSSSGWSARGGQCRNPYVLDRNPCGSSSGSAVAVSAQLCAVAIGTETDGSIVCPSNANGVVGLKPTVGLVSRSGIVPISSSQDTAGPIARTVSDAAILLGIMAGVDSSDSATQTRRVPAGKDYSQTLDVAGLKGARIGIARQFFGFSQKVDRLMEEAISEMKRQGAEILDPADIPTRGKFGDSEFKVMLYEFKANLNKYLSGLSPEVRVRSLEELIQFNEEHRQIEMPFFGQEIFLEAQKKGPLTSIEYREALARNHRLARTEGIDYLMDELRLDAIAAPTGGPAWKTDLVNGDPSSGGSSSPAAVAGYPNISVPLGFVHDLPVGISFFGRAWSESTLIRIAYSYEQATQVRTPPGFLPSLALH